MDLRDVYDRILDLQELLQAELLESAEQELKQPHRLRSAPDAKKVQALAAAFTLQDYLANLFAAAGGDEDEL